MISFKKLIQSFGFAFRGLSFVLHSGQNIKIHLMMAIAATVAGLLLNISTTEWTIIFLCIGMVISLEILNTSIEKLCDFVSPQHHEKIKVIKDLAAAAVLFMAIISVLIGLIVFLPKIFSFF